MAGMYEALPRGEDQPRPPITYLHIHEDAALSLGIFCLPARARIPLHNHPGMTVMSRWASRARRLRLCLAAGGGAVGSCAARSPPPPTTTSCQLPAPLCRHAVLRRRCRVLYGQVHVASCDWLDPGAEGRFPREAVKVLDDVFCGADDPIILFPSSGGNIHQFTALTDCAVLDLMTPPYSTEEGRDCTYYRPVRACASCLAASLAADSSGCGSVAVPLLALVLVLFFRACFGLKTWDGKCSPGQLAPRCGSLLLARPPALTLYPPPHCLTPQVPGGAYPLRGEVALLDESEPPKDFVIGVRSCQRTAQPCMQLARAGAGWVGTAHAGLAAAG